MGESSKSSNQGNVIANAKSQESHMDFPTCSSQTGHAIFAGVWVIQRITTRRKVTLKLQRVEA